MKPDDKLCYCFHVSVRKVKNYIRLHQPRVPSQISECGGAGTGCGWCVPFLKKLFEARANGSAHSAEITLSAEQYAEQRTTYVRENKKTLPPGATPTEPTGGQPDNQSV